jgi:hypothetical protein
VWGDDGYATLGTPAVKDFDSSNVMVTAGHFLDGSDTVHQPGAKSSTDFDGVSYSMNGDNDNGYAEPADGNSVQWDLAGSGTSPKSGRIAGITTWDAIKNHEGDESFIVQKQGDRTGDTSGHIHNVFNNSDDGVREVSITADGGNGDSGGPHYREVEVSGQTQYYITAIHAWSVGSESECPRNPSGGNTMEYIEEYWNLTV